MVIFKAKTPGIPSTGSTCVTSVVGTAGVVGAVSPSLELLVGFGAALGWPRSDVANDMVLSSMPLAAAIVVNSRMVLAWFLS